MTFTPALDSTIMDSDDTQVAQTAAIAGDDETSMLDTQAADQGLAWSVDPDAHTKVAITPAQRSWKMPIALALLAGAAAVTTSVVILWPHHHPEPTAPVVTHPTAQPAPALTMAPADKTFVDNLAAVNFPRFHVGQTPAQYDANTIAVGHGICELLDIGNPADQTIQLIHDKYRAVLTLPQTRILVDDAVAAYCPQRTG